ncbi:uncharacterized protein TRAVEDRAFT_74781 [Trametes versicolor FP-101664 SS1]|uniref:uncharacterized protein n=1 Tax=Trametes versicolor (strain FP-101664) TaxID=717944 RepID=UPI0004621F64|nr:uncharacterized protein TRAVEDRAFT_74781 [Trametes versicolor FP-101664 SS1]EIW53468.1 hypothetical protein TRAVEDRAFT_74781 [Trametes versicolor FP-101664 SS1]
MACSLAHPLWSIAELVREVMKQATDDQDTLVQCARVSHAFSEPALEMLWAEQRGLGRLLGLLPASFKKITSGGEEETADPETASFTLCGAILDDQWARLEYYARWIRVYINQEDSVDALSAAFIIQKLNGRTLFPRLKHLLWRRPCDTSFLLVIFLSPALRSVHLDFLDRGKARFSNHHLRNDPAAAEYAYGAALQIIHSHAPMVDYIELCTSAFSCSVSYLRHFDKLLVLELRQVTDFASVVHACNSSPSLQTLHIHFARRSIDEPEEPAPGPFPEISSVTLRGLKFNGSPQMVIAAIDAVHSTNITHLKLTFDADEAIWKRCTALIASRFAATVRELKLTADYAPRDPDTVPYAFHAWFSPLYAFRRLRTLKISSRFLVPFAITPKDVRNMARAWPRLDALSILVDQDDPDLGLPVTALEAFAKRSARLSTLIFPLPHHGSLRERLKTPVPVFKNAVNHIEWYGGSWPSDVRKECTAYMKQLFPLAYMVNIDGPLGDEDDGSADDEVDED